MDADRQLASELFLSYYDDVVRAAFRFAPLPDLVDDIVQDAFREFVDHAERYDLTADVKPLLRKIVQNIALRYWQMRHRDRPEVIRRIGEHFQKLATERDSSTDDLGQSYRHRQELLRQCIDRLGPRSREIIRKHYFFGKKFIVLAEELGTSPGNIKQLIFRARAKLRQCMERHLK